ncbi:hypothetical protein LOTGIDRAFT_123407, partial [Lottia gigantea]
RGITIVSCLGKLFTSIRNNRLLDFDTSEQKISSSQFGFRKQCLTVDAIFILQFLIKRAKRLYICFVDYKKSTRFYK